MYIDITALSQNYQEGDQKLSCKSPHSYNPGDLFPLHLTTLGGVIIIEIRSRYLDLIEQCIFWLWNTMKIV
jgi:hypothetical protein